MGRLITGHEYLPAVVRALGLENAGAPLRRVLIDVTAGEPVRVYAEHVVGHDTAAALAGALELAVQMGLPVERRDRPPQAGPAPLTAYEQAAS